MSPRPLHVAVAGWLLGPPSGANRRLLALLRELGPQLADGERVTVLHRADFAPPALPGIGWHPVPIPASPSLRRAFAERRVLPRVLRELGATVLDHGFLPLPKVEVPVCLLVHDVRGLDGLLRWPRWLAARTLARACRGAAVVVTPSAWTQRRLAALVPTATFEVVANGVDLPDHSAALPKATSTTQPTNGFVLHVGHVEARKNLGVVVAALAQLPTTTRPELWLAGADAGALPMLQRHAAPLGVRLRHLPRVDDAAIAGLYANARAVVLPSHHEGFGLPALEALAHGVPLLASDATALPEVVGDAAPLLPPDDAAAWAVALQQAIAASNRSPEAAARRRAHAARWPWATAAQQLLAIWRRVHSA
ncbi:MAG: glycosyltransferase family 4 protein [Planctomycetota bacterium]|jgi:glycosyltransferase involved in cell wall biosynthesis